MGDAHFHREMGRRLRLRRWGRQGQMQITSLKDGLFGPGREAGHFHRVRGKG